MNSTVYDRHIKRNGVIASLTDTEFLSVGTLRRGNDRDVFTAKLRRICEILGGGRLDCDRIDVRPVRTAWRRNRNCVVSRVKEHWLGDGAQRRERARAGKCHGNWRPVVNTDCAGTRWICKIEN